MPKILVSILFLTTVASAYSLDGKNTFEVTPSAGGFGVFFTGDTILKTAGPLVAASVGYQISQEITLGVKLGCYAYQSSTNYIFAPLYALSAEYSFSESLGLGFELPVFPTAFLRVEDHRFNISVLPIYFVSGGSTIISFSYGYRLRI